jgi:hypothetical protein
MVTTEAEKFVGVRMENGIKTVRTFGYALNPRGQVGQVYSAVQNRRTVSQQWTGVTYKSERVAATDSWRLNSGAVFEG